MSSSRLSSAYNASKTAIFCYIVLRYIGKSWRHVRARGLVATLHSFYLYLARYVAGLVMMTPPARRRIARELAQADRDVRSKLAPYSTELTTNAALPRQGKPIAWIREELDRLEAMHAADWEKGRVSGAIYHGHKDGELGEVIAQAIQRFVLANPLHPDVFPGVRRMDAEVVAMVLAMYNAVPGQGCGTTTSGGTESILLACKAHRDWARATKGITEPEMVIPHSAHAAFDKAGAYFGIKIHHIPVDPISRKVQLHRVKRAINKNTIMLVGSAVNFSDGVADDIAALGSLATRHRVGLHVDCCMGSFIVPFLAQAGFPTQPFDFRVTGVTSISCDTHKYGFAPKGSSVVMYRDKALRRFQYYTSSDWPGGVYASPTLAGSRPGALIAGAWAALVAMGEEGYVASCRELVGAAKRVEAGLRAIPGVEVMGQPLATIVAFSTSTVSAYDVGDVLSRKGWHLNALQHPASLHICVTKPIIAAVDDFLRDVQEAVSTVGSKSTGGAPQGQMAQIYGLGSSSVVGPGLVDRLCEIFCDALYTMPEPPEVSQGDAKAGAEVIKTIETT